jgi:hypothetical protein
VGIRHRRALEFVGNSNLPLKVPKFWYPIARFRRNKPESGDVWHCLRIPTTGIWLYCVRFWPSKIPAKLAGGEDRRNPSILLESNTNGQIPAKSNSNETGQNLAIAAGFRSSSPKSSNSNRNLVKVA